MRDADQRITDLEVGLAHQQRLCEQLNEVVVDQTRQMIHFERVILRLENQVKELQQQRKEQADPQADRPPHY